MYFLAFDFEIFFSCIFFIFIQIKSNYYVSLQAFQSLAKCVAAIAVTHEQNAIPVVENFLNEIQNSKSDEQSIFSLRVIGEIGRHV